MRPPFIIIVFILFSNIAFSQTAGGPYTVDENTVLLMHFDGNLDNSSTLSNNGTVQGSDISYVANAQSGLGQCLHNNGSSYITIPHNSNLNLNGNWTIEAWISLQEFRGYPNDPYIIRKPGDNDDYQSNYAIQIVEAWGNVFHGFYFPEIDYRINVTNMAPNLNEWYHVAFIRDETNSTFTLTVRDSNWGIVSTNSRTFSENDVLLNSQDLRIGENFNGYIDEVRISNVVRDFSETPVNSTPIVSDISNQTINEGGSFISINLDDYVVDSDNEDSEISWSYSGNTELSVTIDDNRVAIINVLNTEWNGSETITFTATDPEGAFGSDSVKFTVVDSNTPTIDQVLINKKVSAFNLHRMKYDLSPFSVEIEILSNDDFEAQKPSGALPFDAGYVNTNGKVFVCEPTNSEQINVFPDINKAALYYTCQSFLQYYYQTSEIPIWFKCGFAAYEADMRINDAEIKLAYENYKTLSSFNDLNDIADFNANNGFAVSYMFGEFMSVLKIWDYRMINIVDENTIAPVAWWDVESDDHLFEIWKRYFDVRILEEDDQNRIKLGAETEHFKFYYRSADQFWADYFSVVLEEAIVEYMSLYDFEVFEKFSYITMQECDFAAIGGRECINRYTGGTAWSSGMSTTRPNNEYDFDRFRRLIRHELGHLAQCHLPSGNMTAWLNEGSAQFISHGPLSQEEIDPMLNQTQEALDNATSHYGHLPTFEETKNYTSQSVVDYYLLGELMINFIYSISGYDEIKEILIDHESGILNLGFSSLEAFMDAYYSYVNRVFLKIEEPDYFTNYDAFIERLTYLTNTVRDNADSLNSFWNEFLATENFPFAIGTEVAFLYRGAANSVNWAGAFNNWSMSADAGTRLGTSNIWILEKEFPSDAKFEYKIVRNGSEWLADPSNPHPIVGNFGNSELWMPDYRLHTELIERAGIEKGSVTDNIQITSSNLGYLCQYRVYTPAGYSSLSNLPVIYVTDGQNYLDDNMGKMRIVLDNLIADGIIDPVIAVFLDPRDPDNLSYDRRGNEYRNNSTFVEYVTKELIPEIDANYKTNPSMNARAIIGASYGGYNAVYFSINASGYFKFYGINSAYLHPQGEYVIDSELEAANLTNLKFYLSYGTFDADGERYFNRIKNILDSKGTEFYFNVISDGHTWSNWSRVLGFSLEYFFPHAATGLPVVSNIPDQTINEGSSFTTINLDDFVSDLDNTDLEISWSFSGNVELSVVIDENRVATISAPDENWSGSETITFIATDPEGAFDSNEVVFTVSKVNESPVVVGIPDQTTSEDEGFLTIDLDDFVSDPDNEDSEISWTYSGNTELSVTIDENRVATITIPDTEWNGSETITFTATDPNGDSDSDEAVFTLELETGINYHIENNDFLIYPNPAQNSVYISSPEIVDLSVFNLSGQKIIERKNFLNGEIDVSEFITGIYIVKFLCDRETVSRKIIIE